MLARPKNNCLAWAVIIAVFLVLVGELLYHVGMIAMPVAAVYQGEVSGDWSAAVVMAVVAFGILVAAKGGPAKPLGLLLMVVGMFALIAVILQSHNEFICGAWSAAVLGTLVSGFFALLLPWRRGG